MRSYQEIIDKYITDDEQILWSGKPTQKVWLHAYDWFLVPITLAIGGYLIYFSVITAVAMAQGIPGLFMVFPVIGITMLLIGFYLIFGRLWYRNKHNSRDIYVITNKRVLIINTLREENMVQILPQDLWVRQKRNHILLTQTNFTGDIYYHLGLDLFFGNGPEKTYAFMALTDAKEVAKIMEEGIK